MPSLTANPLGSPDDFIFQEHDLKKYVIELTPDEWGRLTGQTEQGSVSGDFFAGFCVAHCRPVYSVAECIFCFKAFKPGEKVSYPMTEFGYRILFHTDCHNQLAELMTPQEVAPKKEPKEEVKKEAKENGKTTES